VSSGAAGSIGYGAHLKDYWFANVFTFGWFIALKYCTVPSFKGLKTDPFRKGYFIYIVF